MPNTPVLPKAAFTVMGIPDGDLQRYIRLTPVLISSNSFPSRALTLSLEDTATGEQFQIDLQKALQESQSHSTPQQHAPPVEAASTPSKPNNFLSERAQLEKERLARQKRLRGETDHPISPQGLTPSTSTADSGSDDDDLGKPAAKRQHLVTPRRGGTLQQSRKSNNATNGPSNPGASSSTSTNWPQLFWKGEIRQTANMHVDPKKDGKPTFRLSDIIGEVRLAASFGPRTASLRVAAG